MTALCPGQLYQKRMKQAFDKKVRPRERDLVQKIYYLFNQTPGENGRLIMKAHMLLRELFLMVQWLL